jgi:cytochrome b561
MGRRSKKEEKKASENQILSRLNALERKIDEKFSAVESTLKEVEKSSNLTTEDQLFFGFVISLLLLLIENPQFDTRLFFAMLGVTVEPTKGVITMGVILITLLIFSIATRYLTTFVKEDKQKNRWRKVSVGLLFSAFYFLIFDLTLRGLSSFLMTINVFLVLLSPAVLTVVVSVIGWIAEKKWYQLYGYKKAEADASIIFASIGLTILIAYYLAMLVSLFTPITDLVNITLLVSAFFIFYLVIRVSNFLSERWKQRRCKKN